MYRLLNKVRDIKSRRLRWVGHIARTKEGRSAFRILTGTPTGKRPLGRPRRRWEAKHLGRSSKKNLKYSGTRL